MRMSCFPRGGEMMDWGYGPSLLKANFRVEELLLRNALKNANSPSQTSQMQSKQGSDWHSQSKASPLLFAFSQCLELKPFWFSHWCCANHCPVASLLISHRTYLLLRRQMQLWGRIFVTLTDFCFFKSKYFALKGCCPHSPDSWLAFVWKDQHKGLTSKKKQLKRLIC